MQGMFSSIAGRYDVANHLLSGGMDFLWRAEVARKVAARSPEAILDLATGSGDLAIALRKANPAASVVGADFCLPMLERAREKGLPALVCADGLALPFRNDCFDVLTVAFGLRNMASWSKAISEMARVLRPGGCALILDFSLPEPPIRSVYCAYLCRLLPTIAGWITGERSAYEYLGESIMSFPRGAEMEALLMQNGFSSARTQPLTLGVVSLYEAVKPR